MTLQIVGWVLLIGFLLAVIGFCVLITETDPKEFVGGFVLALLFITGVVAFVWFAASLATGEIG